MSINYVNLLKQDLRTNAIQLNKKGIERKSAFIFEDISDNFYPKSYQNIESRNYSWDVRLDKKHSHFNESNVFELQSSNSSDALLMSIFCHPKIKDWKGVRDLLDIEKEDEIIFGWENVGFKNETSNKTEIDMKIGAHLFEAKLTEDDFTKQELSIVLKYEQINDIFDIDKLKTEKDEVKNYQLIRNILAAYKHNCSFRVLLDQRRIDLIRELMETIAAVKDDNLRSKIGFVTWQEIASVCGKDLKEYLGKKYFVQN